MRLVVHSFTFFFFLRASSPSSSPPPPPSASFFLFFFVFFSLFLFFSFFFFFPPPPPLSPPPPPFFFFFFFFLSSYFIFPLLFISSSVGIRTLNLSGNKIGDDGCRVLAQMLTHPGVLLHSLLLDDCGVGPAGVRELYQALQSRTAFELLSLVGHTCNTPAGLSR